VRTSPLKHPALAAFTPNSEGLLRKVSELVDDRMLEEIAQCDYGEEAAEHLIELRKIRDTGEVPVPVQFCPLEVLALTRWTSDTPTRTMGRRDHVMRAFACSALLRIKGEPGNACASIEGENETLVQLLASLDKLGGGYHEEALQFLAWRLETLADDDEERPFFIYALLLLTLKTRAPVSDSQLEGIVDWLIEDEDRMKRDDWKWRPAYRSHWLLGLTSSNQRHLVWAATGHALRALAAEAAIPSRLRDLIVYLGSLVAQNPAYWR
jgi:hypothetical protein